MSGNPYSVPQSDLGETNVINRSIIWKIYFVIMLLLILLGLFGLLLIEGKGFAEVISLFLLIPAIVGFFGYVFSKKILVRKIWLVNFYVQLGWGILYNFVSTADLTAGMDQQTYLISNGVMWIISIPYYIALFLYASKNYQLWIDET